MCINVLRNLSLIRSIKVGKLIQTFLKFKMGDTSGGKEVSFEAPYKLFGIGKSLTSKDKKIISMFTAT